MTIRITSGLKALVLDVRSYLEAHQVTAVVDAGMKARFKQGNQGTGRANRIVFLPGDPASGDGGEIKSDPQSFGFRPIPDPTSTVEDPKPDLGSVRAIGDWDRQLWISVWSFDSENANDDFLQQCHADELVEWTKRAVDYVALANVKWGRVRWALEKERQFGAEALLALTMTHPLFDVPLERAYPTGKVNKPE